MPMVTCGLNSYQLLRNERRDVVDGRLVDLRVLRCGDVRRGGPDFLSEWRNGVDQFLLNLRRSSVGSTTIPPRPMSFQGM